MKILFTSAGDTDPVRGYHDGAMLHILRHYGADKVIVFLTQDMENKENTMNCYTRGIQSLLPTCPITYIRSGITEPQNYEKLVQIQTEFDKVYNQYTDAEWLLNISSGTPQIKSVMSLLALDCPKAKAIQVNSPEKRSNRKNHPCKTVDELVEMLEVNEDNDPQSPNRCSEQPLLLLKRHGLLLQIESLVHHYEYDGAFQLVRQNKTLFSEETIHLLQHAIYRSNLRWRDANKVVAYYKQQPLMQHPSDFSEYFQVMELRQKKKQLPDFIVKLSPILMRLGSQYLSQIPGFQLDNCGRKNYKNKDNYFFFIDRAEMQKHYPRLLAYMESQLKNGLRDGPLYFNTIVFICQYYKETQLRDDTKHAEITDIFICLRSIEEKIRNPLAHTITNITEDKLQEITAVGIQKGMRSPDILRLLHQAIRRIQGKDIPWSYDYLNTCIIDSLHRM